MDRTVYYNTESGSSLTDDDSYQSSAVISARVNGTTGGQDNWIYSKTAGDSKTSRQTKVQYGYQLNAGSSSRRNTNQDGQRYYSIPKCHATTGAGARHIFQKKTGAAGGGLSKRILHSGISRVAVPFNKDRDEFELQYGTVLVLHLQCKNIFTMTPGALEAFVNLKNLYLYKNNIRRIQGLDSLTNLELLDLSRNNLERVDNLDNCTKLKKLYLGFNEIQVVEGLERLGCLEELLIDDQDMPPEQPMIFSPGIMASVAHCLVILDLSSNQLKTLDPIANLPVLRTLLAADNRFNTFESILDTLESLRQLHVLTLKGNPIASKPNYKTKIIGVVFRLEVLDDKDINDTTRHCVQKLRLMKEYRERQREQNEMLNRARVEAEVEQQSRLTPHHIDIGNPNDFNFSTPTRRSPQPPLKSGVNRVYGKAYTSPEASENEECHSSGRNTATERRFYESRARNAADDDFLMDVEDKGDNTEMSDMAKIIFRLSNLDEVGPAGDGGNKVNIKHANYWEYPGSSLSRECRPLSPLEGEELVAGISYSSAPTHSASAPVLGQSEKRSGSGIRPKPAAPGGRKCSNNANKSGRGIIQMSSSFTMPTNMGIDNQFQAQSHFYGRTLSPLMELPTPESLTARSENN